MAITIRQEPLRMCAMKAFRLKPLQSKAQMVVRLQLIGLAPLPHCSVAERVVEEAFQNALSLRFTNAIKGAVRSVMENLQRVNCKLITVFLTKSLVMLTNQKSTQKYLC